MSKLLLHSIVRWYPAIAPLALIYLVHVVHYDAEAAKYDCSCFETSREEVRCV